MFKKLVIGLLLLVSTSSIFAEDKKEDTRTSLGLTSEEKAILHGNMQTMLGSIQGILAGLGEENREKITEAAKQSGNIMPRNMNPIIREKTPMEFKKLGHPTHMMFEEIAVRAETDDMASIATLTSKLMNQCMTCHTQFKAD